MPDNVYDLVLAPLYFDEEILRLLGKASRKGRQLCERVMEFRWKEKVKRLSVLDGNGVRIQRLPWSNWYVDWGVELVWERDEACVK